MTTGTGSMRASLLTICSVTLLVAAPTLQADFFVSPTGVDTNPGTKAKPFASLETARDAVRRLKAQGKLPRGGVTVWLRGGDYPRTNALELSAEDSGTPNAPIVWRAWKNETVRLLGGRKLNGFEPITDAAMLAHLDEKAKGKVVQLNLRSLGITNFGEMKSRGFGRPVAVAHCELFFGGKPMTLARWPNEGEFTQIAGYPATQRDEHGGQLGALTNGFTYPGDRPRRWQDTSDLWAHGYWAYDWANSYEKVASLNVELRLVKTAPPYGHYGFRKDQRVYFLNVLEELDQPGEWFLDRKAGVLYFWPPVDVESLNRSTVEPARLHSRFNDSTVQRFNETLLSLLDQPFLKLTGVSNVTFRGLILEATRATAVEIHRGGSNRVSACLFRNIGNSSVVVEGGFGHGVIACDFENIGDGGVSLTGGDRQTLTPGGHFVENCHFQHLGRWSKCYVPAIHLQGVGLRASHNLIHDHPHCAILFWGNEHLIEFNEIHHIALETGDVGAIYTGRDWTFRGNRIRHNFIHHTGGVGMGSMGVYMDDCVSGTEVFGNIFYKVHWAMFIGGGRDHRVENNLFVDCDPAVRMDGRGLDKSPVWFNMVYDTMRKRLAEVPQPLYRERYPAINALDRYYATTNGVPPEGNIIARNVCVGKWLEAGWHAKTNIVTLRDNYVGPDAGVVSVEKMDFRIKKDSPVWQTGFQRIPVEQIGLRDDKLRRELKRRQTSERRSGPQ
jgi:hypothetical protein